MKSFQLLTLLFATAPHVANALVLNTGLSTSTTGGHNTSAISSTSSSSSSSSLSSSSPSNVIPPSSPSSSSSNGVSTRAGGTSKPGGPVSGSPLFPTGPSSTPLLPTRPIHKVLLNSAPSNGQGSAGSGISAGIFPPTTTNPNAPLATGVSTLAGASSSGTPLHQAGLNNGTSPASASGLVKNATESIRPICGKCMVFLPQVQIVYFDPYKTDAACANGKAPAAAAITPAPSPALLRRRLGRRNGTMEEINVSDGYTYSAPSMYVLMPQGMYVTDSCGTVGSSYASGIVPMPTGGLSSISYDVPVGSKISDYGHPGETTKPVAATDLACPTWGLSGPWNSRPEDDPMLDVGAPQLDIPVPQSVGAPAALVSVHPDDTVVGPPWYPIVLLPNEVLAMDPAWAGCLGNLYNPTVPIFDPPRPLQPQAVMVSDPPTPATVQAEVTSSPADNGHAQMPNLAPPASSTQLPPTAGGPAQAPAASPAAPVPEPVDNNAPAASPAQQAVDPPVSPVNDPQAQNPPATPPTPAEQSQPMMSQLESALAVSSPAPAADPAAPVPAAGSPESAAEPATPAPAAGTPENAAEPGVSSPAAGGPENVVAPSAQSAGASPAAVASEVPAPDGSIGGSILSIGGFTDDSPPAGGSDSDTANSPAQAAPAEGSTPTTGGTTTPSTDEQAVAPAFQGEAGSVLSAAGVNPGAPAAPAGSGVGVVAGAGTTPAPAAPPVINVGGAQITADSSSNFVVNGQTLNENSPIIVSNTPISILPGSSAVAIGGETQQIAQASPAPAVPVLTVGGTAYTADTSSNFVINGQTLNPSNAITISNTPLSILPGNTAVAVGSSTQAISYPTAVSNANSPAQAAPALTVDGTTYQPTGPSSAYIVAGQTLTPGVQITVGSTPVSLASNGAVAVVGSSTQNLQPSITSTALTFGGSTYQPTGSSSCYIIGGQTISPGAGPITVSGTPISVASNGATAVIGSSTQTLNSPITPTPEPEAFTVGGHTITADASSLLVGGATMTVGQSTTIDGTPVVLGPSGTIKIGSSEIPLPTGTATGGLGSSTLPATGKASKRMAGMSTMMSLLLGGLGSSAWLLMM